MKFKKCSRVAVKLKKLEISKEEKEWGQAGFNIIEIKEPSLNPLFNESDYCVVRKALLKLPEIEREMVILKFWARYDVFKIADLFGLRVKTVEAHLNQAYMTLKNICLECPEFSLSTIVREVVMPLAA